MARVRCSRCCLILAVLLSTLALVTCAEADWVISGSESYVYPDALPSFTGDIIVSLGGSLSLTGYGLTLPGNIFVAGDLTLEDCTLTFAPSSYREKGLEVGAGGLLDAATTVFETDATGGPDPNKTAYLDSSGTTSFVNCNLDHINAYFTGSSINSLSSTGLPWGQVTNGYGNWALYGGSQNTITGYSFHCQNITYGGNTVNYVEDCTFEGGEGVCLTQSNADSTFVNCTTPSHHFYYPSTSVVQGGDFGSIVIWFDLPSALDLVDIAPGTQTGTVITSTPPGPGAFRLELTGGVQVWEFNVHAVGEVALTTTRCNLRNVFLNRTATATLTDSQLQFLSVTTAWGGPTGVAADIAVANFHDGSAPQTVSATLNGGPFIDLDNTSVLYSWWEIGDFAVPSQFTTDSVIEDSTIWCVHVFGEGGLTVRRSTIESVDSGTGSESYPISTSQLLAEDSLFHYLVVSGTDSSTTLQNTELAGPLIFRYILTAPPYSAPSLIFYGATFSPGAYSYLYVGENTVGAQISGTVAIDPSCWVEDWMPGATLTRTFPVLVKDAGGTPIANAPVEVEDAGGNVIWSGATDPVGGYALAEVTFTDANYSEEYRVYQRTGMPGESAPLSLLCSTPIILTLGPCDLSYTSFEGARYPWTEFAGNTAIGATWRQLGGSLNWRGLVAHAAHSGDYAMNADVEGADITGLRLDLPVSPTGPTQITLRTWMAVDSRAGDASSFVGFTFGDSYPSAATGWTDGLGWEVLSDTQSRLRLGATSLLLPAGIAPNSWHLVEMTYYRTSQELSLWLDGISLADHEPTSASGQTPSHAVLGAAGFAAGARQDTYYDDASVSMREISLPLSRHVYGSLSGPEILLASGATYSYLLRYGDGYPALNPATVPVTPSAGPPVPLTLTLDLPACCTFVSSVPMPDYFVGPDPVWEVDLASRGEECRIPIEVIVPSGVPTTDKFWVWETTPGEGLFAADVLPVHTVPGSQAHPDLAITKRSALTASPGDTVVYRLRVANQGLTGATHVQVTDHLPAEMGGGNPIVANLAALAPGDSWSGLVSAPLAFGVPNGTVFVNTATTACSETELTLVNNTGAWPMTVTGAHDPNQITVSPTGGVNRGDTLTYTLECENTGVGTAYAVYATAALDAQLDDSTLLLPGDMAYDPMSRTLLWTVGTLPGGASASTSFEVEVSATARRARPILGYATVYFPSVPEETPTNVVFNIVLGSFPDVLWNHWAVLPVELAYENGVVGGYPSGNYLPALSVDRGQMAVFIARSLAGGDSHVPTGPVTPSFADVPTGHWAYKYVEYAVDEGVVGGYPDGTYRPSLSVDRGQMAVFIARALAGGDASVPSGPPTPTFPDVTASNAWNWCYKHVEYAVGRAVVGGYPDGNYHPEVGCTRDQMAVFVARAFELPV